MLYIIRFSQFWDDVGASQDTTIRTETFQVTYNQLRDGKGNTIAELTDDGWTIPGKDGLWSDWWVLGTERAAPLPEDF